jgi:preprotein translocase subunit SecA
MNWANIPENEPIEHRMISNSIGQAQVRVEGHNFDIRKRVLEYDDVVNRQREIVYNERREILGMADIRERYLKMLDELIAEAIDEYCADENNPSHWDLEGLYQHLYTIFPVPASITPETLESFDSLEDLENTVLEAAHAAYDHKMSELGEYAHAAERNRMLRAIDLQWQRHLTELDVLREGIGLMSVAQRDPLVEYKREAFNMFNEMRTDIRKQAVQDIFRTQVNIIQQPVRRQVQTIRPGATETAKPEPVRASSKLGRNDLCWCGSGKKYKNCHLKADQGTQAS